MAKPKTETRTCGKCGESGHSIRTCLQMKPYLRRVSRRSCPAMAKLTSATRNRLPSSKFGLPKRRKYPMEDRDHQIRAMGRATEMEHKGKLSPAQASLIRAKANRLLGK